MLNREQKRFLSCRRLLNVGRLFSPWEGERWSQFHPFIA